MKKIIVFASIMSAFIFVAIMLTVENPAYYAGNYYVDKNIQISIKNNVMQIENNNKFKIHSLNIEIYSKNNLNVPIQKYNNLVVKASDSIDIQIKNNNIDNLYCKGEYRFGFLFNKRQNTNRFQGNMLIFVE